MNTGKFLRRMVQYTPPPWVNRLQPFLCIYIRRVWSLYIAWECSNLGCGSGRILPGSDFPEKNSNPDPTGYGFDLPEKKPETGFDLREKTGSNPRKVWFQMESKALCTDRIRIRPRCENRIRIWPYFENQIRTRNPGPHIFFLNFVRTRILPPTDV